MRTVEPAVASKAIWALWNYRASLMLSRGVEEVIPTVENRLSSLIHRLDVRALTVDQTEDIESPDEPVTVKQTPMSVLSWLLSHPAWTGIGGIAAVVTIVLSVYQPSLSDPCARETLDDARLSLHSAGPSKNGIKAVMRCFPFGDYTHTSLQEAELLMRFLSPTSRVYVQTDKEDQVAGTFGEPQQGSGAGLYQITIWKNSYNFPNRYGIRFGVPGTTSWGCNDSYMEVAKQAAGGPRYVFSPEHLPSNFAKCK